MLGARVAGVITEAVYSDDIIEELLLSGQCMPCVLC